MSEHIVMVCTYVSVPGVTCVRVNLQGSIDGDIAFLDRDQSLLAGGFMSHRTVDRARVFAYGEKAK